MGDQNHSLADKAVDVFENPRILVGVQPQIVAAHTSVLRARELTEAFTPEDVVLHASDIFNVYAGLDEVLRGGLRLLEYSKRALLLGTGLVGMFAIMRRRKSVTLDAA